MVDVSKQQEIVLLVTLNGKTLRVILPIPALADEKDIPKLSIVVESLTAPVKADPDRGWYWEKVSGKKV